MPRPKLVLFEYPNFNLTLSILSATHIDTCNLKFFSGHFKRRETGEINFSGVFYLTGVSRILSFWQ